MKSKYKKLLGHWLSCNEKGKRLEKLLKEDTDDNETHNLVDVFYTKVEVTTVIDKDLRKKMINNR